MKLIALIMLAQVWPTFPNSIFEIQPLLADNRWQVKALHSPLAYDLTRGTPLVVAVPNRLRQHHGEPTVTQIYSIKEDILAVEIEAGKVFPGRQVAYRAQRGDRVNDEQVVIRRGKKIGRLVGEQPKKIYTFDQYQGRVLSRRRLMHRRNYRLRSATETTLQSEISPLQVFLKNKPIDLAQTSKGPRWAQHYTVYLQFSKPLQVGETYTLSFEGKLLAPYTFTYTPLQQRSAAVHVSHVGFRPNDLVKAGFLSTWMGTGGGINYSNGMRFWLIDEQTEAVVYEGKSRLSTAENELEDAYRNYNQANVYVLDFQDFSKAGIYRLCVETVGCSFSFPISESVWQSAFVAAVRGLYHQRSGIRIGPPHTFYERPRAFHPDDGLIVYQSQAKLFETTMGLGSQNAFEALTTQATEMHVPNAWGGYFDAGDWDRRIQHLDVAQSLLDLVELFPKQMAALDLNIPESDNVLPDVLDEALWGIDFFRRLQHANGGIPGGIESAAHPHFGEASWQESLKVMAYAPDIWASYWYASAAAQAAFVLERLNLDQAKTYKDSALAAFGYAEQQLLNPPAEGWHYAVNDLRNLAALELWRITLDDHFHDIFLSTTVFTDSRQPIQQHKQHSQARAAFLYARLQQAEIHSQIQFNAHKALLAAADRVKASTAQAAFQWGKLHADAPIGWGTGWSSPAAAIVLTQAHYLEQDERYLAAIIRASQAALGANPENLVYTTGLGMRSPRNPLLLDQRILGIDPPPGITVYGPLDITHELYQNYWFTKFQMQEQMFPAPQHWPTMELFVDVHTNVAMTEFTIQQTIGPSAYVWGYLFAQE